MIFYFTGTGNSEFAAKGLLAEGEMLINMAEAFKKNEFSYKLSDGEALGLVFPVYFYTVPTFVESFIEKLEIEGASYVYSIITCGGSISQAGGVLKSLLSKKGLDLAYVKELLMPDNSMLFYQIPEVEKGKARISAAKLKLEAIKKDIESRKEIAIGDSKLISKVLGKAYERCQKTEKFWVEDTCIHCGLCEKNCPESVIKLVDGYPIWEKDRCCKCSACINRCPAKAIQYGKNTAKRNRYVCPEV